MVPIGLKQKKLLKKLVSFQKKNPSFLDLFKEFCSLQGEVCSQGSSKSSILRIGGDREDRLVGVMSG